MMKPRSRRELTVPSPRASTAIAYARAGGAGSRPGAAYQHWWCWLASLASTGAASDAEGAPSRVVRSDSEAPILGARAAAGARRDRESG